MWFSMLAVVVAIYGYASERFSMELTSITIVAVLLLFFHFMPVVDSSGHEVLTAEKLLLGFANPALISVLCLLVLGQAVVQTGALNNIANIILKISRNNAILAIGLTLFFVMIISAFLNNTPVVVIFIPILASLAKSIDTSASKVMIPLSYVSILGGMMTLIGSSTNLLVSGILVDMGLSPLNFFDFTIPGIFMAAIGFVYVLVFIPRLLTDRASLARKFTDEDDGRQFVAQIDIDYSSDFVGQKLESGKIAGFPEITIRMIQRGEHAFLPPFDDEIIIRPRDIIVMSAPKKELTKFFSKNPDSIEEHFARIAGEDNTDDPDVNEDMTMAEIVISPASKMVGKNLRQISFHSEYDCVVLGIQRQSRTIRARLAEIRLAAGDVLLVMGKIEDILALHESRDFLLMEWSTEDLRAGSKGGITALIFGVVVGVAACGIVPIVISAFAGVAAILMTGCLNLRQAARALDIKIILLIAASLALGTALQATGGAFYIAQLLINTMDGASPQIVMSALFFLMMCLTNILSNNAAAVLFTPIAVSLAAQLAVDPRMFIFAVVFACNCSFATPIGYQTNLMVMGPGHYKFSDFLRSGIPLALIMWITYSIFAHFYF